MYITVKHTCRFLHTCKLFAKQAAADVEVGSLQDRQVTNETCCSSNENHSHEAFTANHRTQHHQETATRICILLQT